MLFQQNLIFGPEPGEGENTHQCQGTDYIYPEGRFHAGAQSTHVAHILWVESATLSLAFPLMFQMMMTMFYSEDHRTCAHEEQSLEESMCHQVEHTSCIGANPNGSDHEAQLADRRISQDLLDIKLPYGDRCRKQSCYATNQSNQILSLLC